jgi:hypothetical protein
MARWHDPIAPSIGELLSDARPAEQEIVTSPDGSMWHRPPVGSVPHMLSQARNSANEATREVQAAHEAGRKPMMTGGMTPAEERTENYTQDLYANGS